VRNIDGISHAADLPLRVWSGDATPTSRCRPTTFSTSLQPHEEYSLGIADITAAASSALIYAAH